MSTPCDTFDAHILFLFLESKPLRQRKFKSARLVGEYDKPWTVKKDPRMLWDKVFFIGLTIVGLGIGAYIIYSGWASVENPPVSTYLLKHSVVLDDFVILLYFVAHVRISATMNATLVANPANIQS